ncbi:MAG: hypothetical protein ACK5MT_14020 [Actinomycetales bacterium]
MEPVVITSTLAAAAAALSAGATAGLTEVATAAIRDAYERLKEAIGRGAPSSDQATLTTTVALHESHPEEFEAALTALLGQAKLAELEEVQELTQALQRLVGTDTAKCSGLNYTFHGKVVAPNATFGPGGATYHVGRP